MNKQELSTLPHATLAELLAFVPQLLARLDPMQGHKEVDASRWEVVPVIGTPGSFGNLMVHG